MGRYLPSTCLVSTGSTQVRRRSPGARERDSARRAARRPRRTATARPTSTEAQLSYAELLGSGRAHRARRTWPRGAARRPVVLWGPNTIEWVVAALAVSYAGRHPGAGQLALHRGRGRRRRRPHPRRVGGRRRRVPGAQPGGRASRRPPPRRRRRGRHHLAELLSAADGAGDATPWAARPDDVADILFTSGTTGRSKGAMSAHRQTIGVARAWAEMGGVREDDRYLVVNPFFHSFGYKIGIVVGLLTGATIYPVATFDVDATMRMIEDERITVLPGCADALPVDARPPDRSGSTCPRCGWRSRVRPSYPWCSSSGCAPPCWARDRPGGHGVRDDRGGGGHDVPRRRLGRDRRDHQRPRDPGHGDPDR